MKKKIATLCKELIDNCNEAKKLLQAGDLLIGEGSKSIAQSTTTDAGGAESSYTKTVDASKYDSKLIQNVLILVHAIVIQEWHIFLNEVFGEAVMYYLKGGELNKLPSGQLELKRLNATRKITKMRENIYDSAKERFGGLGYKDRINKLRGIYGISSDEFCEMIKKHVIIRNIFQHHRGKVRKSDIKEIAELGQDINVLDDDGDVRSFSVGMKIVLSNAEIENLLQAIEKYSESFNKRDWTKLSFRT